MSGFPNQGNTGCLESGTNRILEDHANEPEYSHLHSYHNIRGSMSSSKPSQDSTSLLGRKDTTRILGPRLFSDDLEDDDPDF